MLILELFQGIYTFFLTAPEIAFGRLFLIALGLLFVFLSYKKILEPLVMLPLGIGMLAVNAGLMVMDAQTGQLGNLFINPLASNVEQVMYYLQIDFLQPIYNFTFSNGLIACLVFMGIGAITDIDILLARPYMSLFLAICAELGTVLTLPIAMAMGLAPNESAAIALVGGADGPMVLYGSIMLARDLFVPITVVAYVYLGVIYAGYPFLAKIIPRRLRGIEMDWRTIPQVSPGAKFTFAILACGFLCLLFPVAAPLFGSFFVGLAIKEAGVLRFIEFLSGPLLYGATFFLGFTLGALLGVDIILNPKVLTLLVLGIIALTLSGLGGITGGLIYHKITKEPFNPLIGIAAVSCVPTTAKVAQKCAVTVNKKAMILPFAMGPCVAGVITTAIFTGIYITGFRPEGVFFGLFGG
ncbi:MAG: sodium ion-translocating decarboxylase subunit beta [Dehalococcoidales bacterium]|jgi:oxaloacetate decarboxylase beta subunit|nr:sodium ion-translocating decarboxylase subunit beta [Dehalococcoidales bacterium]MDP7415801.1 sodium ion-translocating decarboxylase subunit beta [Dehalococcoidales bacterium]